MEFVRVLFPTSRRVRIDGAVRGLTNRILQVNAGTHRFRLDGLADYSPPFIDTRVTGTTISFPLVVQFVRLLAVAEVAPERRAIDTAGPFRAPAKRRASAKKKRKPAAKKGTKKKPATKKAAKAKTKRKVK